MTQILWFDWYDSLSEDFKNRCIDEKLGITVCHNLAEFQRNARLWQAAAREGMFRTYRGEPCSPYCVINYLPAKEWHFVGAAFKSEFADLKLIPATTIHKSSTECFFEDKLIPISTLPTVLRSYMNSIEEKSKFEVYGKGFDDFSFPRRY
jgi:hypothetical protein